MLLNAILTALLASPLLSTPPPQAAVADDVDPHGAAEPRAWRAAPDLDYGPHAVGFRVIQARDSTRAFRPKRDWSGRAAAETVRPVLVSLWYPATGQSGRPMSAGDFRLLREAELDFREPTAAEAERLRAAFVESAVGYGTPAGDAAELWDARTPALRGARPATGRHPAVLYVGAVGVNDPLLPAYLASHGFVVAAVPSNGRMTATSLEFSPNPLTLDTSIDDLGFVHGLLRTLPEVDPDAIAVASFSSTSLAGLLWQMRDMQADAVVTLEGWERYRRGADLVRTSVHYDPARLRVPFLMLERAPDEASPAYAKVPDVADSLRYADVLRVAFRDAAHGDFLSHVPAGHTEAHSLVYELSARMIRLFLAAHLEGDTTAASELVRLAPPAAAGADFFTLRRLPALPAAPTEEELFRLAEEDPVEAVRAWREAGAREPERPLFREAVLARVARYTEDVGDRTRLREMIAEAYPGSAGARLALGEAYLAANRLPEARRSLTAALELAQSDADLAAEAREALRSRIEERLREAGG